MALILPFSHPLTPNVAAGLVLMGKNLMFYYQPALDNLLIPRHYLYQALNTVSHVSLSFHAAAVPHPGI